MNEATIGTVCALFGILAGVIGMFFFSPKEMSARLEKRLAEFEKKIDGIEAELEKKIDALQAEHNALARSFANTQGAHDRSLNDLTRAVHDLAQRFEGFSTRLDRILERFNGK